MLDFTVHSPRLTLRSMKTGDAADLCRIVTHRDVGRMLFRFPPDWTTMQAEAFIHVTAFHGDLPFRLGVYHGATLVGSVGVSNENPPDIYYFIDPKAQGQGFGGEALYAFCKALFDRFKMPALVADAFNDNPASQHILTSIGFVETGQGSGTSAARVEPAPITLYRLTPDVLRARP